MRKVFIVRLCRSFIDKLISLLFENVMISLEELLFVDIPFLKKLDIEVNKIPISKSVLKQINQFILTSTQNFILILNTLRSGQVHRLILSNQWYRLDQMLTIYVFSLLLNLKPTMLEILDVFIEEFLFVELLGEFLGLILFKDLFGGEDTDGGALDLVF